MNKFLHMNSLFTKIILAVLSFAVIICVFIPYTKIPAVETKQDVSIKDKIFDKNIGKEQETFNMISTYTAIGAPVFNVFSDAELTKTVDIEKIPVPDKENVYYFVTYAYAYDVDNGGTELEHVMLRKYTLTLTKDTKNNSPALVTRDNKEGTIDIRVPNATTFDFTRVIDSRKAWARYDNPYFQPFNTRDDTKEVTSLPIKQGESLAYYVAITLKSEDDPKNPAAEGQEPKVVYYALDGYTLYIYRDDTRRTLPTVGEVGGGILSEAKTKEAGEFKIASEDTGIISFMVAAAISTLLALIVPNKFQAVELGIASVLGVALAVVPVLDLGFYTKYNFLIEPGVYILMALGVVIILAAVFNFIRCRDEYRKEQIRIYGEDVFKKKKVKKEEN
ncbi:MAG: hypothetical protein IKB86_02490 [Clostridia bacterium]|nr:hypothetical protein [Clostridia bacterium]